MSTKVGAKRQFLIKWGQKELKAEMLAWKFNKSRNTPRFKVSGGWLSPIKLQFRFLCFNGSRLSTQYRIHWQFSQFMCFRQAVWGRVKQNDLAILL